MSAMIWHGDHELVTDYLAAAPQVRAFRTVRGDDDLVTLTWRNPDDGPIAFLPPHEGRHTLPTADFVDAVTSLDRRLFAAMGERVRLLRQPGGVPGVQLDVDDLARDHMDRSTWLQRARARDVGTDWDAVRRGAAKLLGG